MGLFASRVKIGKTHKLVENVHIVKRGVRIPLTAWRSLPGCGER